MLLLKISRTIERPLLVLVAPRAVAEHALDDLQWREGTRSLDHLRGPCMTPQGSQQTVQAPAQPRNSTLSEAPPFFYSWQAAPSMHRRYAALPSHTCPQQDDCKGAPEPQQPPRTSH